MSSAAYCGPFAMDLRVVIASIFIAQISAQTTTIGPYGSTYVDCCELKLMDSNLQVAIDSNSVLPQGRFTMLKSRFCTTDVVFIQIWTQINGSTYQFKWQTSFKATQFDLVQTYTLVHFDSNPVTISAADRLAVYNPSNTHLKFSVPYEFDQPTSSAMYFSALRFDNASQFTPGLIIQVEDLRWPRTFAPYLSFCQSLSDCPELTSDNALGTTYSPYNSGYIPASCCTQMVSCDIGDNIKNSLRDQNNDVSNLKDTVNVLQKTVENLFKAPNVTEICPDGFTPGVYGVGSCYIVHRDLLQMGEAVIQCRDRYSARLLNIQSQQEDTFLKNFLLNTSQSNQSDVENFWTSGMYNMELKNWYWYDDDLVTKMPFGTYRNWKDGSEPAASTIYDVCSVFTTIKSQDTDYWQKAVCTDLNYYVCELPKICL